MEKNYKKNKIRERGFNPLSFIIYTNEQIPFIDLGYLQEYIH